MSEKAWLRKVLDDAKEPQTPQQLQAHITPLLAVIEQCRSALESCHALQVHGEVITKEECNLCRVLEVIKKATQ